MDVNDIKDMLVNSYGFCEDLTLTQDVDIEYDWSGNGLSIKEEDNDLFLFISSGFSNGDDSYSFKLKILNKDHLKNVLDNLLIK